MKILLSVFIIFLNFIVFGKVEKANSEEGIIRFEYRLINRSDKKADVNFYFTLPKDNERQKVFEIFPEPGYSSITKDDYGNSIVVYEEKNMMPSEVRSHSWIARVKMFAVVYKRNKNIVKLSDKERNLYLQDRENYGINNPIVLKVKNEIVKETDKPYDKAIAIYKYLINNIEYYRDDIWEPAPDILKNKKGSCSEFNYTLVSLLRASGIPARYTGSFTIRPSKTTKYDEFVQEDAVFHRWTEVFLPNYGWIPFDASRGSGSIKRCGNYLDFVGRLPSGALQSYRGDGGKNNPLKWDYISTFRVKKGIKIRDIPVSYYISFAKIKGSLKESIKKIKNMIDGGLTRRNISNCLKNPIDRQVLFFYRNKIEKKLYPILIEELIKTGNPMAIYYILYERHLDKNTVFKDVLNKFADEQLTEMIGKYLKNKWDWQLFEYWWRKARPFVKFNKEINKFVITKKYINIY